MRITLFIFLFFLSQSFFSQNKKVLFLGNSYTAVNDLPQLIADIAISVGDTLIHDKNTPGGFTLAGHSTNATSLSKIAEGDWDFVVLQEQSQLPSFPINQVQSEVFPFAEQLNLLINENNTCCETVFYMTWGRENGDAGNCEFWPPLCTYEGMDSLLFERYMTMGESNDAIVSPVGALWRYIRDNYPQIDLYATDGSHPSSAGSYAAACSFYSVIFRKDPVNITFDYTLDPVVALNIRNAAKTIVYDSLSQWYVGSYDLTSDFSMEEIDYNGAGPANIQFQNLSENATGQIWDFDGGGSGFDTTMNPFVEDFLGFYNIVLTSFNSCDTVTSTQLLIVDPLDIQDINKEDKIEVYPNPAETYVIFDLPNVSNNYIIKLYDIKGELVFNNEYLNFSNSLRKIEVSMLPSGFYFFQLLEDGKNVVFGKIEILH